MRNPAIEQADHLTPGETRWSTLIASPMTIDLPFTLAQCFLAGDPNVGSMIQRANLMLGREWDWIPAVVESFAEATAGKTRPRLRDAYDLLSSNILLEKAWNKHSKAIAVCQWRTDSQMMQPVLAAAKWPLPRIESEGELADWFWLDHGQLDWFADLASLGYKDRNQKLRHYHYRIVQKQSGGKRLIEAPKPRIKRMQREILDEILVHIPSHPAVHGFVKGRSIQTFAAPHTGKAMVLRMDLKNFFPSFRYSRIQTFFRTLGYPERVADLLGGICTTATPKAICEELGDITYSARHLPQGAPTSPALANCCSYRLDCRLNGLAQSASATYTRYADDLAFSGDKQFARVAERFSSHVAALLTEEGFAANHRKTRLMRQGVRQHLTGLTTNEHLNVSRREFDVLKAILTNCARLGADAQNRDGHSDFRAHLNGRIGFVETVSPEKAKRLRSIYEKISW